MFKTKLIALCLKEKLLIITLIACFLSILALNVTAVGASVTDEPEGIHTTYSGNWPVKSPPEAFGGHLAVSNDFADDASCTFSFHGTSITWLGAKDPRCGISEVLIDGKPVAKVDLYDAKRLFQQVLYTHSGLTDDDHTIMIKPTDQSNPLATDHYTVVDAFFVDLPSCGFSRTGPLLMVRGGNIGFMTTLHNDTSMDQTFDFATAITSPDDDSYAAAARHIFEKDGIKLTSGTSKSKYLTLSIPLDAPYGNYTYRGYIGKDPDFYPLCKFDFSVVK